ncbi:MAG TPA: hypothetical protein VIF09_01105 [Polyangiaceae bacterium]|jgi:hypothetical protein
MRTVERAYLVLATSVAGGVEVDELDAHARRFFRVELSRAPGGGVHVTADGGTEGARLVTTRAPTAADFALADEGEVRAGGGGLALLARRCKTVFVVERQEEDDVPSLTLATVLASAHLGPIVDPRGPDLFGVKTARGKLEALGAGRLTR